MTLQRQFTPQKGTRSTNDLICALCAFLWLCNLLRGSLHGFRLFSHRKTELHLHVALNLAQDLGIVFQRLLRVLPSLAQALAFIRKPGATLFDRTLDHRQIEQIAFTRNAFAIHDVKLTLAERRRHFVLRHFYFRAIAGHTIAVFDRTDTTNIESQRGIELERATAGRRLGITKHHSDLLADLIDKDEAGV